MTPQRQKRLREQIRRSRARLMVSDPALAMVLMYLRFVATKDVYRISTNGREILFDPDWFQKLGKKETDYILSHEVIHIVLDDTRRPAFFTGDRFHHACDIIACSALLTTTMSEMRRVVELAVKRGIREKHRIIIGGAPITQQFCDEIGADGYSPDAAQCVSLASGLMERMRTN